jgi:hypothetical protein
MARNQSEESFIEVLKAFGYFFAALASLIAFVFEAIVDVGRRSLSNKKRATETRALAAQYDTNEVFQANVALSAASGYPDIEAFMEGLYTRFCQDVADGVARFPHYEIRAALITAAGNLYKAEGLHKSPLPPPQTTDAIELSVYRDQMRLRASKAGNPETPKTIDGLLRQSIEGFIRHLPDTAIDNSSDSDKSDDDKDETDHDVPMLGLTNVISDIGAALDDLILPLFSPLAIELHLFSDLRQQIQCNANLLNIAKPSEYKGVDPIHDILHGTPLEDIFRARIPFDVSIARRLEHTAIVAGSGWGKTQLLQTIIADDLQRPDSPALIVVDSTNRIIERVQHLELFVGPLKERILIIDPERSPAPALNMFDLNTPRMQRYDEDTRERVESDVIALFNYVFSSIQNPLTDPMRTAFTYMVRLLITIPNANITTLRKLLEDNPKGGYEASAFKEHMERLDPTARDFFRIQYFTERVHATRSSILQRLSSVISVPAFERMFSTVNKIDFFDEMQRGSCILVNTSEALLKDASTLFGRYIIARIMAAAFERASLPDEKRKPAFLIVDEAAPYFDDQFEKLLTRVRQFKLGVVIAFQHLEQASDKLRSAIASNTSVKYAGGLGYADSRWLSREMRTTPEALLALSKDNAEPPQFTNYACYVRGMASAVELRVPFYTLEKLPRMTASQHTTLLERNKARTSHTAPPKDQASTSLASSPSPLPPASPKSSDITTNAPAEATDPGEPSDKW